MDLDYDYLVVGSGFGGSVAALRLSQKGYKVLVVEQGRWFKSEQFPKTNWNLRKWLWVPFLRFYGFSRLKFFRHITVMAGAGVGGGSLVYANTLPVPRKEFYSTGSWTGLADWEKELAPYYETAAKMLGASTNPSFGPGDLALEELSKVIGKHDHFEPTRVAVFFGEKEKIVPDPYFDNEGPDREGCRFCGGCMVGCRYNAKNTLDKNYLYLAQKKGAEIWAKNRVDDVVPLGGNLEKNQGESGYMVRISPLGKFGLGKKRIFVKGVVFSGGVLGTIPLLLKLKKKSLPNLSDQVGYSVRTNNEALIGVVSRQKDKNFSEGVAIGSIVHTDSHSHLEPVRYSTGSGFFRLLMAPMLSGKNFGHRLLLLVWDFIRHPIDNARAYFVGNWANRVQIMLFMQTIDSRLRLRRGLFGMQTGIDYGVKPSAFIPEAQELAKGYAKIVNGKPLVLPTESLFGIPTTAHILGGACIGRNDKEGVVNTRNEVFNYKNLLVVDGSSISANPGVNPSLSITALAERAMDLIP
ncbi:MAG: GMC family oxidoreductase [Bacteroidales bacterium]|nr:GMC family oxidoreductase [Bacteroidales bacterium]